MTKLNIIQSPSPNYQSGRKGWQPIAIVNHITDGLMPGCLVWMRNGDRAEPSSSHYLVTRSGEVHQSVQDSDTAWANGDVQNPSWPLLVAGVNPNLYTLSIEHEGKPLEPLTEAQYLASLELQRLLCERWNIAKNRLLIIGHYEINSVSRANCPGPLFPWERLMKDLNEQECQFPEAQAWVREQGISDGLRPKDPVTREELWEMLRRKG